MFAQKDKVKPNTLSIRGFKLFAKFTYKLDRPQHWALKSEDTTNTEKKNWPPKKCIFL
jgi:hypothetical protein